MKIYISYRDMRDNRIEEVTKNAFTPMTSLVDL